MRTCELSYSRSNTYARECKGELVAHFLGFLDKNREFLAAELVGAQETANITDSGLEYTMNAMRSKTTRSDVEVT
jgi:hypothetical protein